MSSSESSQPLIRMLEEPDIGQLLALYAHLHEDEAPMFPSPSMRDLWTRILHDPAQVYVGAFVDGQLSSVANVSFIPNLTRGARPFAVIENVVTHPSRRRCGLARAVVSQLLALSNSRGCYKVMLLSSASRPEAHSFYTSLGFEGDSKRAFVRRFPT
jgi:ribosomal protein S18 acetylase RimI-like enzyme